MNGTQVPARTRHTMADARLLGAEVHAADIQERDGAEGILQRSRARLPFVKHALADSGHAGKLVTLARDRTSATIETGPGTLRVHQSASSTTAPANTVVIDRATSTIFVTVLS